MGSRCHVGWLFNLRRNTRIYRSRSSFGTSSYIYKTRIAPSVSSDYHDDPWLVYHCNQRWAFVAYRKMGAVNLHRKYWIADMGNNNHLNHTNTGSVLIKIL